MSLEKIVAMFRQAGGAEPDLPELAALLAETTQILVEATLQEHGRTLRDDPTAFTGSDIANMERLTARTRSDASGSDPDLVRRFDVEVRVTGGLQHPGIPPIYERGVLADGRRYFTMQGIRGKTFAEMLRAFHYERESADTRQGQRCPSTR